MATLKEKTLSGMLWSLLQNVGTQGISFITFIFLARLLTPEMFGLTGMLAIFIELSMVLSTAGFNQALIQKKDADEEDFSTVFWINLVISLVIYVALFFSAPLISGFYEQPILTNLTRVLSIIFVIEAFSLVQQARLTKEMQFKKLAIIKLPAVIIGGIIGIAMALMGFGVWSLVGLRLGTGAVNSLQLWIYSRWMPLFAFSTIKAKDLFSFGGRLMASKIINRLFVNAYIVVIGKFFPVSFVGYYNISQKLIRLPSQAITSAINSVTFSAFSSIQDDKVRLKKSIRRVIQQVLFWLCPVFVLAGVLAGPLFSFVLTDKWLPAVPYFQLLCIIGIFYPLNIYCLNIINVMGRSDLSLKLVIVTKIFAAITIIASIFIGIWALVVSQSVIAVLSYFIVASFSGRLIDYSLWEQIKDIAPMFMTSFVIGGLIYFLNMFSVQLHDWVQLILGFGIGGGFYLWVARWWGFEPYLEFKAILQSKLPKIF